MHGSDLIERIGLSTSMTVSTFSAWFMMGTTCRSAQLTARVVGHGKLGRPIGRLADPTGTLQKYEDCLPEKGAN